jgi:hypothetical protein
LKINEGKNVMYMHRKRVHELYITGKAAEEVEDIVWKEDVAGTRQKCEENPERGVGFHT